MEHAQQRSPPEHTAKGQHSEGGVSTASNAKKPAVEGVEPAAVGEIGWIGAIRKAESQTQVCTCSGPGMLPCLLLANPRAAH